MPDIPFLDHAYPDVVRRFNGNVPGVDINAAALPPPETEYRTANILVQKSRRSTGGYTAQQAIFVASRYVLRRLALVVASAIMHDCKPHRRIKIALTHAETEVEALFIDPKYTRAFSAGAFSGSAVVEKLHWSWHQTAKHPWIRGHLPADPGDLPHFDLTDDPEGDSLGVRMDQLNYLRIDGGLEGMGRLVEFLLNISDPRNEGVEFDLEGEDGFRGVAPASPEVRFGLPGSIWWDIYGRDLDDGEPPVAKED